MVFQKKNSADIVLKSDDIHCQMCAETVQHTLQQVRGVSRVKVSIKDKTIQVNLDEPGRVKSETLIDALKPTGYIATEL